MTLETFFEKFNQFADAPDAVAKMRELILESAIRGMLVPHNASDEPASELLKRIARLQDGQVRKQAALPSVGDDAYLEIPPGWEWTRLGNTGRIFNGDSVSESGKAELAKVEDGLPFIATKDVGYGRAALVYVNGLKVPLRDPRFKVARANAVLICAEGGSAGRKIGVTDRDICFGNKLFANEVWEGIHHRYVFYVYQAPTFFKEFAARMTGIIGGIARSEFLSLPFPLPPLAEQKRIVAKVDELMALCDRLEAQQQERETRHAALARASLARFADAPTPANLPFLFHPSYAIRPADLRKSILTLAVQGKLVPQDPSDEPAEDSPTTATSLPSEVDKAPFEVPSDWRWKKLGAIALIERGGSPRPIKDYITNDPNGLNWIKIGDTEKGGKYITSTEEKIRPEGLAKTRKVYPGDFLLTNSMSFGRPYISKIEGCIHDGWLRIHPPDQVETDFLYHLLSSPYVYSFFRKAAAGAVVQNLNADKVRSFLFCCSV